jgi:uncharacterized protein (DUF2384 family)
MEIKQKLLQNSTEKDVRNLLKNFFNTDREIHEWLSTPNANFGNSSPQKLIDNGRAGKIVLWLEANLEGY